MNIVKISYRDQRSLESYMRSFDKMAISTEPNLVRRDAFGALGENEHLIVAMDADQMAGVLRWTKIPGEESATRLLAASKGFYDDRRQPVGVQKIVETYFSGDKNLGYFVSAESFRHEAENALVAGLKNEGLAGIVGVGHSLTGFDESFFRAAHFRFTGNYKHSDRKGPVMVWLPEYEPKTSKAKRSRVLRV